MSNSFRRYEILLPLWFNDGAAVPNTFIAETIKELRHKFGAISAETQAIRGEWESEGKLFRDENLRLSVDVEDSFENQTWFLRFKERIRQRFQQIDPWITSHPIDLI